MSFSHKVVHWVMQRRGYLVRLNKRQNFFSHFLADFRLANLTSGVIFFNEIVRVGASVWSLQVQNERSISLIKFRRR